MSCRFIQPEKLAAGVLKLKFNMNIMKSNNTKLKMFGDENKQLIKAVSISLHLIGEKLFIPNIAALSRFNLDKSHEQQEQKYTTTSLL